MLAGMVKGGAKVVDPAGGGGRVAGSEEGGNWIRALEGRLK